MAPALLTAACSDNGGPFAGSRSETGTILAVAADAPDGDRDGIPDAVEQSVGTDPTLKDNDVFADPLLFVMQQYRDFFGREGDPSGIHFWSDELRSGSASPPQIIDIFFNSEEFQNGTAPIIRLYFAFFVRLPELNGFVFWVNIVRSGTPLEVIADRFAGSTEFQELYGNLSSIDFVRRVYLNVLGREPEPTGWNFWVDHLEAGRLTRGQLMLRFSEAEEYRHQWFNFTYVVQMYMGLLRRSPDAAGFAFWTGELFGGRPGLDLISSFLSAPEYHNRFLPSVTPG